jgi:hypothetical protein
LLEAAMEAATGIFLSTATETLTSVFLVIDGC